MKSYVIWSPMKRVQHLLYFAGFSLSFLTGVALPGGNRVLHAAAAAVFGGHELLFWWHDFFGFFTVFTVLFHLLYLAVRTYIESLPLRSFPFWLSKGDLRGIISRLPGFILGRPADPVRFTPERKALYWFFLATGILLPATGFSIFFWDHLDLPLVTSSLGFLASLHAGSAFLTALFVLWHVHDIIDGGRRLPLLALAFTGRIGEEDLQRFYPEEYRRLKEAEEKAEREKALEDSEKLEEKRRAEEQQQVEKLLESGNQLAREGQYHEAAEEYRRALEVYPAYSQAQYNLALVLEKAGSPKEALKAYERFMTIDPFHPLAETVRKAISRLQGGGP